MMDWSAVFSFHIPSDIVFGLGAVQSIGQKARELGAQRVLIVTDKGVVEAGVAKKVQESLESEGIKVDVFDAVKSQRPTQPNDFDARILAVTEFQTEEAAARPQYPARLDQGPLDMGHVAQPEGDGAGADAAVRQR